MRLALWLFAFLLPAIWLAVVSYLFKDRVQFGKMSLGDITNILAVGIAVFSLVLAVAVYRDSARSGAEQQRTLTASRAALEAVVDRATTQQKLLEITVGTLDSQQKAMERAAGTLDSQLVLIREQTDRELEKLRRKPVIQVALGDLPWYKIRTNPRISFLFKEPKETFHFIVSNVGTAPAIRPTTIIRTSPEKVFVAGQGDGPGRRPNVYQISGLGAADILPITEAKTGYSFAVDISVPNDVNEFDLYFRMFGENLAATEFSLHVLVTRPPKPPASE